MKAGRVMISRRTLFATSAAAVAAGFSRMPARAETPAEIRTTITGLAFPSAPPLLEAMNAGSIDFGQVGDTPPIFAQAANARIVYVAGQPITNGQGVLVKSGSAIRAVADLKGRRIGFTKGSSAH